MKPPLLTLALAFTVALSAAAAPCPPVNGEVTSDTHAIGCADLRLTIAAENVTLVIEGATGTISVTSNAIGTTLRVLDSTVAGNLTLRGSQAFADVRRSTVIGADVIILSGARNTTIVVVDSTLTGAVVASVFSSTVRVSIAVSNSTLNATRYAACVVGATIRDVSIHPHRRRQRGHRRARRRRHRCGCHRQRHRVFDDVQSGQHRGCPRRRD